jgi:hypothetical protein
MNPARRIVSDYRPARVTVAVLVHIPHMAGYFSGRFDVLKMCLGSLVRHTPEPHDLLVLDNASCPEVRSYLQSLQDDGVIDFLFTSRTNIGKLGALRLICGVAPGEFVAYSDDDAFFYPGWLSAHMEIVDGFPNVGMVSGSPWRTLFDHGISSNLKLAQTDPDVRLSYGQVIPEAWEVDYAVSLGRDVAAHLELVRGMQDIVIERQGVRAFAAAGHNQFLSPRDVLRKGLEGEWNGRLMGGMIELDDAIDSAGYLRLMTLERTTRNIGGLVTADIAEEARRFSLPTNNRTWRIVNSRQASFASSILRLRPIHWLLQGLYNRLFWALNSGSGKWR